MHEIYEHVHEAIEKLNRYTGGSFRHAYVPEEKKSHRLVEERGGANVTFLKNTSVFDLLPRIEAFTEGVLYKPYTGRFEEN